nr:hypothetical protein GCM10010200_083860 [Actinomadura rugatobispora]
MDAGGGRRRARPGGYAGLLNFYAWDTSGLRDDVRDVVVEFLGDARQGVLIVDETGFLKKGAKSAGVARQYSGTAGRIENSQIGVFLACASPEGRALIDRESYLPKGWTGDRERCREAGVPDEVAFATKPALAQQMIERVVLGDVPFGWVTADEAYGQDAKFRLWLEACDIPHVVAVPKSAMVVAMNLTKVRSHHVIADLPEAAWKRLNCGDGARGHECRTGRRPRSAPCGGPAGAIGAGPSQHQRSFRPGLLHLLRRRRHPDRGMLPGH